MYIQDILLHIAVKILIKNKKRFLGCYDGMWEWS